MLGSFGMTAKRKPWEESVNVPFVIRWPAGIPAGRRLDTLFSTVDITPTLLGLAGQSVPARMQGADLSPVLRGTDARGPESAFIMAIGGASGEDNEGAAKGGGRAKRRAAKNPVRGWRGVRTDRFTYVKKEAGRGLDPWLLYDNQKDPYQMRNLLDDGAYEQQRKDLDALVGQWLKRAGEI
jgi:arylsulfatase A-like enzyme